MTTSGEEEKPHAFSAFLSTVFITVLIMLALAPNKQDDDKNKNQYDNEIKEYIMEKSIDDNLDNIKKYLKKSRIKRESLRFRMRPVKAPRKFRIRFFR